MYLQFDGDEIGPRLRVKVERAREHISDLDAEVQTFLTTTPWMIGGSMHDGQWIYFLAMDRIERLSIQAIASDALQNLRSALDHLVYQLVIAGHGNPTRQTSFPIAANFEGYQNSKVAKLEGMAPTAKADIDLLRPYNGGNNLLWLLHDLNNIDKHRFLRTTAPAIEIGPDKQKIQQTLKALVTSPEPIYAGADRVIRLGDGVEFSTDLALSEDDVGAGGPALPLVQTTKQMADLVNEIIVHFEPMFA